MNFRRGLVSRLLAEGYRVIVSAPRDEFTQRVIQMGCEYRETEIDNHSKNIIKEAWLFLRCLRLLRRERPNCVLCFTVKPNVYMSLAARIMGIAYVNNITGVGVNLRNQSVTSKILRVLYKLSLGSSRRVFFQNLEDRKYFVENRLVDEDLTDRLPGSGISLVEFDVLKRDDVSNISFLMVARLLKEKGVEEYCRAAKLVQDRHPNANFKLVGPIVESSPSGISKDFLESLCLENGVQYLGQTDNIRSHLAKSACIVLPSFYGEGVPRSLLEAAASGLPIITTNETGCRDAIEDGITGFLCEAKNVNDLAKKMEVFLQLPQETKIAMGLKGREKMSKEFDEEIVIEKYLSAIAS